jgi:hypothetical protein
VLEAVVELSDHAVEEVALGGRVPVALFAAAPVVGVGPGGCSQGGEGPEVAGVVEAVVLYALA